MLLSSLTSLSVSLTFKAPKFSSRFLIFRVPGPNFFAYPYILLHKVQQQLLAMYTAEGNLKFKVHTANLGQL